MSKSFENVPKTSNHSQLVHCHKDPLIPHNQCTNINGHLWIRKTVFEVQKSGKVTECQSLQQKLGLTLTVSADTGKSCQDTRSDRVILRFLQWEFLHGPTRHVSASSLLCQDDLQTCDFPPFRSYTSLSAENINRT